MSYRLPSALARPGHRRLLSLAAAFALTATAAGGVAATAQAAAPYAEVVSRASGVDGAQPAVIGSAMGAVSNDGRFAAISGNPAIKEPEWDGYNVPPPDYYLYVRDTVANTTYQVTTNRWSFANSFDDNGRYLTYASLDASGSDTRLWVLDTLRKTTTLVGRATGANGAQATFASGLVSGDGRSVVFTTNDVPGSGPGIYRRTLATNVTTRLGDLPTGRATLEDGTVLAPEAARSISKDGSVITFDEQISDGPQRSLIVTPTQRIEVNGIGAMVSADGSTVAYLSDDSPERLVFRTVATGAETSYPAPTGAGTADGKVAWVAANGSQAAVTPDFPISFGFPTQPIPYRTQLFDRGSRAYFSAGPFSKSLYSPIVGGVGIFSNTVISRNGRYSLFSTTSGALIGDNYGASLRGGADLPPANAYFAGPARYCKGETSTSVTSHLTPDYLPPVKSLTGVVTIDGKYGGQDTFTTDRTTTIPLPADAKDLSITATVTFLNGQTATGTYDYGVHNSPYC